MALFQEIKDNEFNDLLKLGWLVEDGTTAGSYKLSAKGLEAFNRLFEGASAKDRVLMQFKIKANAIATPDAIKGYMG